MCAIYVVKEFTVKNRVIKKCVHTASDAGTQEKYCVCVCVCVCVVRVCVVCCVLCVVCVCVVCVVCVCVCVCVCVAVYIAVPEHNYLMGITYAV